MSWVIQLQENCVFWDLRGTNQEPAIRGPSKCSSSAAGGVDYFICSGQSEQNMNLLFVFLIGKSIEHKNAAANL